MTHGNPMTHGNVAWSTEPEDMSAIWQAQPQPARRSWVITLAVLVLVIGMSAVSIWGATRLSDEISSASDAHAPTSSEVTQGPTEEPMPTTLPEVPDAQPMDKVARYTAILHTYHVGPLDDPLSFAQTLIFQPACDDLVFGDLVDGGCALMGVGSCWVMA